MAEVGQVKDLLGQVAQERSKGLMVRRSVMGAILVMFLLFFANAWFKVKTFDAEALVIRLEQEAARTVWPVYSRELQAVGEEAVPALGKAFQDEAANLLPKIAEALQAEAVVFQTNMATQMKAGLEREMLAATKAKEEQLRATFPKFADQPELFDDLMVRLGNAAQGWAQVQLDTTFQQHVLVLQSINESVQVLERQAAADRETVGDRSAEDVLVLMAEIMNARLGEGG